MDVDSPCFYLSLFSQRQIPGVNGIGKYSYYEVNQQTVIWEEVANDMSVLAAKSEKFKEKEH